MVYGGPTDSQYPSHHHHHHPNNLLNSSQMPMVSPGGYEHLHAPDHKKDPYGSYMSDRYGPPSGYGKPVAGSGMGPPNFNMYEDPSHMYDRH